MSPTSLRLKLTLWLLLPLLGLLFLGSVLTFERAKKASSAAFDRVLYSSAKQIQEGIQIREGDVFVDIPYAAFDLFEATSIGRIYYRVCLDNGTNLTGYDDLPLPNVEKQEYFKPIYFNSEYKNNSTRSVAIKMPLHDLSGTPIKVVWIVVSETLETRSELVRDILIGSVVQETILVGLAVLIFAYSGRAILLPIRRLSRAVATKNEEQLNPIEVDDLPDELRPMLDAVNVYTARMQNMLVSRRRFFDDAAHQLKTPLAVMRAQLELAIRDKPNPGVLSRLNTVIATLKSASDGVTKLLSLARLEPDNGRQYVLATLDLVELGREVASDWVLIAREHAIDLGFESSESPTVMGERSLLIELVSNLIDNAIRYAGPNSRITVTTGSIPHPFISVCDDGPGIADSHKDNVLKRFYRIPGVQVEGSGLGLSIVREICRVHSAILELSDTPGGGLTVKVSFLNSSKEKNSPEVALK